MVECNTIVSTYVLCRHLEQCCTHPSQCKVKVHIKLPDTAEGFDHRINRGMSNVFSQATLAGRQDTLRKEFLRGQGVKYSALFCVSPFNK